MSRLASGFVLILFAAGFAINGFAADEKTPADRDAVLKQEATTDVSPVSEKLDVDKDGYISKEEAGKLKGLNEVFDSADENKDGRLDATELSKFLAPATK